MTNFIILQESITNGYKAEFLFILSLICIFAGISIIITKNPVLSVLFLIALFFTIAVYLMMLGFYFIGLSYLLVYVGAISILFLFILMLINVRISELLTEGRNSLALAILAIITFNFSLNTALPSSIYLLDNGLQPLFNFFNNLFLLVFTNLSKAIFSNRPLESNEFIKDNSLYSNNSNEIANISSQRWDSLLIETTHITSIGNTLYSNLFILLIVTSFILLLAMVGSIVITVKDKKNEPSHVFLPLTSGVLFPKGFQKFFYVIIVLGLLAIMIKYPVLVTSKLLDIKWVYTIYSIAFIYPLWCIRVFLLEKNLKFTFNYFIFSALGIILLSYFIDNSYFSSVLVSVYGLIIPFSPYNIAKFLATKFPFEGKMHMHLSSSEFDNTKFPENFHKAEASSNTTSSSNVQDLIHQENINELQGKIHSLEKLKANFKAFCNKNNILIVSPTETEDKCIGFEALDSQIKAIHDKRVEIQVLYEESVNKLVKAKLNAKGNTILSQQVNSLGTDLFRFHSSFPLFSSSELKEINQESSKSGGNRYIHDPRVS